MKNLHLLRKHYLLVLSFFLFTTTIFAQITFPIEVFRERNASGGWNEASAAIDVTVAGLDAAGTEYLYLKVNNLNDGNRMQYRVRPNGASYTSWQTAAPNQDLFPKDAAYGGLGGGFGTNQFVTPVTGFDANGSYQIQFRFEHELEPNKFAEESGYRILEMELWEANSPGQANLFTNGKTDEDPALWVGPFGANNTSQANAGQALWEGTTGDPEDVLKDVNGATITATCADCHVSNGYDLKYFNYSNKSIQARANFHGLSYEQGRQIAQYIRDLSTYQSSNGRPWNPPFQPGPGADIDPDEWAAGQTLDAVLESDTDMLPILFGSSNPTKGEISTVLNSFEGNTNIRTQKLSVQFPDWNEWLPRVHPKDLPEVVDVSKDIIAEAILTDSEWIAINAAFQTANDAIQLTGGQALADGANSSRKHNYNELFRVVDEFVEAVSQGAGDSDFPSQAYTLSGGQNSKKVPYEEKNKSLGHYVSVKAFELIQTNDLHEINSYNGIDPSNVELLQWPIRHWVVFQNAAHVSSSWRRTSYWWDDDDGNDASLSSAEKKGIYMSSIWYQVQLTLTPGHRMGSGTEPNDYAYNLSHVNKLSNASDIMEPARFLQNYMKNAENRKVSGVDAGGNGGQGWSMRELSPWRLFGSNEFPDGLETKLFDELGTGLAKNIRNVFIDEVTQVLEDHTNNNKWGTRITLTQSTTKGNDFSQWFRIEEEGAEPKSALSATGDINDDFIYFRRWGEGVSGDFTGDKDAVEVDAAYSLLDFTKDGTVIDEDVFNRFRAWADATWDKSTWSTLTDWPVWNGGGVGAGSGTWPPDNEVITSVGNGNLGLRLISQNNLELIAVTTNDDMKWTATPDGGGDYYLDNEGGGSHPRLTIEGTGIIGSRLIIFTGTKGKFEAVVDPTDGTFTLQCQYNYSPDKLYLSHAGGVLGTSTTAGPDEIWRVGAETVVAPTLTIDALPTPIVENQSFDISGSSTGNIAFATLRLFTPDADNSPTGTWTDLSTPQSGTSYLWTGLTIPTVHQGYRLAIVAPEADNAFSAFFNVIEASVDPTVSNLAQDGGNPMVENSKFNVAVDASAAVDSVRLWMQTPSGSWTSEGDDSTIPYSWSNVSVSAGAGTYNLRAEAWVGGILNNLIFDALSITVVAAAGGSDLWPDNEPSVEFTINSVLSPGLGVKFVNNSTVELASLTTNDDMLWTAVERDATYDYIQNVSGSNRRLSKEEDGGAPVVETRSSGAQNDRVRWEAENTGEGSNTYYLINRNGGGLFYLVNNSGNLELVDNPGTLGNQHKWTITRQGAEARIANEFVEELDQAIAFSIYPNPFTAAITLVGVKAEDQVNIYDVSGAVVFKGKGVSTIDLSALKPGVYLVEAAGTVQRIIKN